MRIDELFEGEVIPFPSREKETKYDVTFNDLYRNFIHLWNTGDEWGDIMGAFFAVAIELHKRNEGPPDSWDFSPGVGMKSYDNETEQDKYDQALSLQQGEFDIYDDLKYANTPTLEKFGKMLIRLRDTAEVEGKSY